jgi:hypothetical protein
MDGQRRLQMRAPFQTDHKTTCISFFFIPLSLLSGVTRSPHPDPNTITWSGLRCTWLTVDPVIHSMWIAHGNLEGKIRRPRFQARLLDLARPDQ